MKDREEPSTSLSETVIGVMPTSQALWLTSPKTLLTHRALIDFGGLDCSTPELENRKIAESSEFPAFVILALLPVHKEGLLLGAAVRSQEQSCKSCRQALQPAY